MIAATLGPVASAFSICALGSQWRQHLLPEKSVDLAEFVDDPAWYVDAIADSSMRRVQHEL